MMQWPQYVYRLIGSGGGGGEIMEVGMASRHIYRQGGRGDGMMQWPQYVYRHIGKGGGGPWRLE